MRNPIDIYDKSIANQEPLRSLFEKQIISGANTISADDIDRCAQDLIRNNLDAVKAWLELSFPANNGPNGQTILANNASARFFIEFHWINRSKGFHHARRFLDEERTKRKWRFRTGCVIQKGSKVASDKAQAKRPGSLSANAAPSHVMVSLKSNKNIHTKSDTVRCGSAPGPKYKNPHNRVALTSDPRRSTGSVMETSSTVPPKSSSSPTYHRSERLYSSQNKRKFWTTNPSSINNIESSVTSVHPSKRLRTVCDADGGTSKISAGSVKKKWVPVHAAPSLLYVRKLRPRKPNQDLSQDLHQSFTPNILAMDNQRVKNLDNTSLFSNDQQTKGTGSAPKLVPLDNSIAGDTKDVVLHEAIMDADETQTDGATWRVKGAKVTTNTDSKLHEWQEPRRSPRIRKIESKDMNTCMSVTLLSSNTQNATGGPASNLRPRKKNECDLRSSQISGALSRKRQKSSESNMKQYRIKLDSSSLPVESATQKGKQSTSVNGKPINDGFNFHSAKSHRKKMDNTIHLSVPSSVAGAKSLTKKKQTKNRFRKISASVTGSAINQRFKSDNVPITSQERDSDALLFDRQSERSKQSDKFDFFQSLDIQTNKADLPVRTLPLMEVTVPTPAGIQHSVTCQGDMTTSLVPHSVSSVKSEHTVAEASAAVLESNAVQSNSMASEYPSTSAYHVNQHVEILEEDLQQPDAGFSSKSFPTYLREEGMDDENTSIMPFDDDMNLPADLTYLEAEDVENEQDDVIDTLCRFPKTPLQFLPPLWAESRQEICESFDWFRSYQGGVYHAHNVAKGYLLGGFPARRDTFAHGGRLIISHGGGKAESIHSKQGQLSSQPATDQLAQDKSVRALWNTYQNNRPLVLLVDERYALFPYDLKAKNVSYAVLGFYTISDAWAEYQPSNNESGRVVRYKFAFRWCDDQGIPWWHKEASDESCFSVPSAANDDLNDTARAEIIAEGCNATGLTTTVMSQWSNNHDAASELKGIISHKADDEDDIDSKKSLLGSQERIKQSCLFCSKPYPQVYDLSWTCLNPDCSKFFTLPNGQMLPDNLEYSRDFIQLTPSMPIPVGFGTLMPAPVRSLDIKDKTAYAFTRGFHCDKCGRLSCRYQWEMWQCRNCGNQVPSAPAIREASGLLYQTPSSSIRNYSLNSIADIIQLSPRSFRHDKGRGTVVTFILPHNSAKIHHIQPGNALGREEADSIFSDYQTQAMSGDLKFRRWPMRAHKCRGSLLTNYFSQNSGAPYKYVGGDAYTVPFDQAPLAVVRARDFMQKRVLQALNIPAQFNEVLSAAYMERQKMAFHSDNEKGLGPVVAGLSLGSPALMHFRLLAKHDPERRKRGILLSIVLRHGDILVMDGNAVQNYYEHTVVPTNFRIAATARQINADHA